MFKLLKLSRLTLALGLIAAGALAPNAHAAYVINFDSISSGSNASLDPVAQANGVSFTSAQLAADLDSSGFEILDTSGNFVPGFTHWEAIPGVTLSAIDPNSVGRGTAPSPVNALDARFDQVLMKFAAPTVIEGISFSLDSSSFGDLQARNVLLLDANGKTLAESPFFTLASTGTFNYSFGAMEVSGVLLPASKLYDNIGVAAVPEPSTWVLSLSGLTLLGLQARRRRKH